MSLHFEKIIADSCCCTHTSGTRSAASLPRGPCSWPSSAGRCRCRARAPTTTAASSGTRSSPPESRRSWNRCARTGPQSGDSEQVQLDSVKSSQPCYALRADVIDLMRLCTSLSLGADCCSVLVRAFRGEIYKHIVDGIQEYLSQCNVSDSRFSFKALVILSAISTYVSFTWGKKLGEEDRVLMAVRRVLIELLGLFYIRVIFFSLDYFVQSEMRLLRSYDVVIA